MSIKDEEQEKLSWVNPDLVHKLDEIQSLLRLVLNEEQYIKDSFKKAAKAGKIDKIVDSNRNIIIESKIANLVNGIEDLNNLAITIPIIKEVIKTDEEKKTENCYICELEKQEEAKPIEKTNPVSYKEIISKNQETNSKSDDNQSIHSQHTLKKSKGNKSKGSISKSRRVDSSSVAGRFKNNSFEKDQRKRRSV